MVGGGREPARVPEGVKQTGETQDRWSWVEPSVRTERMRTALDNGVKGGKWYSLVDDHQRWPNAFFTEHGLFSLSAARVSLCPSSMR